jgi:hypothetical protein
MRLRPEEHEQAANNAGGRPSADVQTVHLPETEGSPAGGEGLGRIEPAFLMGAQPFGDG